MCAAAVMWWSASKFGNLFHSYMEEIFALVAGGWCLDRVIGRGHIRIGTQYTKRADGGSIAETTDKDKDNGTMRMAMYVRT